MTITNTLLKPSINKKNVGSVLVQLLGWKAMPWYCSFVQQIFIKSGFMLGAGNITKPYGVAYSLVEEQDNDWILTWINVKL